MQKLAVILHAKPGMATDLKNVLEMVQGPAESGWEDELTGRGIARNTVWHSPDDNIFVLVVEAEDPQDAFRHAVVGEPGRQVGPRSRHRCDGLRPATMKPLELLYDWTAPDAT